MVNMYPPDTQLEALARLRHITQVTIFREMLNFSDGHRTVATMDGSKTSRPYAGNTWRSDMLVDHVDFEVLGE